VKILYVSQYFPPEMGAPAARAAELARHWVNSGHDVTVLTGFPNHPTGVLHAEYRKEIRRLVVKEEHDGIHVVRTWLLPLPNRRAHERMLNYASFWISASITGSFLPKPDVVIGSSPQLLVGLSGWWISRWQRVPFIFEVRDLWPESLEAVGIGSRRSLLHRVLRTISGFLYQKSNKIVVVSPAFQDHLVESWGVPREKIAVVENGVEAGLFAPADSSEPRRRLGFEGKYVVCYAGTLGMAHGLSTLIEAAAVLQQSHPDIAFLLVGEGAEKESIQKQAVARGLSNLQFLDQQPRQEIPKLISCSDACLVLLRRSEVFKTVIPTKMLEFMSCARPVILGVEGQAKKIVEAANAGIFIEPENVRQLVDAIVRLKDQPEWAKSLGRNGRHYILENATRQVTAARYLDILKTLIPQANAAAAR
jgi:putative colanic acid biosynthesis glycosyltransferase WcaI